MQVHSRKGCSFLSSLKNVGNKYRMENIKSREISPKGEKIDSPRYLIQVKTAKLFEVAKQPYETI